MNGMFLLAVMKAKRREERGTKREEKREERRENMKGEVSSKKRKIRVLKLILMAKMWTEDLLRKKDLMPVGRLRGRLLVTLN